MDCPIASERKRVDNDRQFPKKGNFSLNPKYKKKNPSKAHQQTDHTMISVDKTPKPIPCYVLVKLRERISADKDQVKRYFQMIMSEQLDFDIRLLPGMVDNSSSESEVHLVFTSMNRARKAYTALQKLIKAKGSTIESVKVQKYSQSTDEKNAILFKCETEIQEKAVQLLEDHKEKLSAAVRLLDKVQIRKYVSLAEYERKTSEKEALQDKVLELENQMKQFKDFLNMTRDHLKEIQQSNSIKQEMVEIRKAFGRECHKFISTLPMYARRGDILDMVMKNQVSVILGETGSGKSTQLVQYLHQCGLGKKGIIACTQPRKVAAISLARHVSSEMGCTIGEDVGYQVGMQTKKGENTSIMYMTDHVLLNDCLRDKLLKKYSCVIIDEAHERSIYTDLLIGIVKSCLKERPDFKVIITSATIDPEVFVKYFGGCPVLKVSGRMFPVDVVWKDTPRQTNADYILEAVGKAIETHQTEDQGDILVFLTSPTETERACLLLEAKIPVPDEVNCLQLHGRLQCDEQQRVFEQTPPGKRKIVFATNSAETSITIPGIKYVIDTGLVKEVRYDPKKNRSSLEITTVNQSSAEQRRGRAGRISAGKCFRLYTKEEFESSEKISTLEILRVHVSGALLKLLEVGISNPLEFDYVQPPPMEALQYGMKSLKELEAVDDQGITEVGKQMAKLPLEPHLSRMVLYGIEEGIGFEVLVLAAVTSTSGSVFFRKGTENEKEMADKLKTTFCHQAGDSITFVGVYREWDRVPDHQKNKWCVSNFINAKAMRFSRDTVREMIKILKVELNLKVPYKFQPEEESLKRLPHIIFKTYARRHICFFLGHDKAGYLNPQHGQIVQVHPSSALKYLGSTPKWLVYQSLLTTSQDFAMNLTPVEERFVLEATESGMLSLDLKHLEAQILRPFTIPLGSFLMKELIGPKYSVLNNIKREISAAIGEKTVIIDPKHATGELKVFCQINGHQIASNFIFKQLESRREKLREETCELPLDSSPGSVRAILGQGGETKWILMPDQYVSVIVKVAEECEPQAQEIMEIFAKFGEIISHFEFKVKKNQSWGKITYKDPKCASEAVGKTSEQPISATPENRSKVSSGSQEYKMRLKWCRRPSRGFGFVTFNGVEDCIMAISSTTCVHVGSTFAYLRPSKGKDNEIFVHKLDRNVDEIQLQSALKNAFPTAVNIDRVSIAWEKHVPTTEEQLSGYSHQISQQIETSLGIEKKQYEIELIKPKEKDFYFTAYLTFKSPDDGQAVHSSLKIAIGNKHVTTEPLLSTSIRVLKEVYETSKTCIQAAIAGILERRVGKLDIKTKELPDGKRALYIRADNVGDLAEAKKVIHEITQGEVIDCSTGVKRILLSVSAKEPLNQIMSSSETFIQVDSRQSFLTIYGHERGRTLAKINLNKYLDEMVSQKIIDIPLRGDGKPVGLMKALMQNYGLDLQRLIEETGATRLKLELRRHILCFQGTSDAFAKLEEALKTCINGLPDQQPDTENSVDCAVCFCPIDDKIFRIECCSHPYCQECIKNQIRVAIEDKEFPITCAQEGCGVPIEWKTIKNQVSEPLLKSLVVSSASAFVSKDLEAYAYCSTPDCPMVYQITDDGKSFMCSSCQVTTCTTCKIEYHKGLSCAMYQGMKRDKNISLKVWLEENPQNRRKCPECKTPIEKNGGCNHMTCLCCKKHICWSCNKTFSTATECYDHLSRCGGIFPNSN